MDIIIGPYAFFFKMGHGHFLGSFFFNFFNGLAGQPRPIMYSSRGYFFFVAGAGETGRQAQNTNSARHFLAGVRAGPAGPDPFCHP